MKRLNPDTGKPFVRGDTRADGFLFAQYNLNKVVKKTGYFLEVWSSPKVFEETKYRQSMTISGRSNKLLQSANSRCLKRKRGIVTITQKWLEDRISAGVCELTGLPFNLSPAEGSNSNIFAPSLDRKDSNNPDYSPENCRVVLHGVNVALNEFGLDAMLPIFKKLVESPAHFLTD